MSRLIVNNLPTSVTDTKIKELFSQKGVVTDVQLKYTKNRKCRRFGFVGYKTTEQANAAIKYFNNTYIDTSKISVELCADRGDVSKSRAWSKYAPDSSAYKKLTQQKEDSKKVAESDKICKKKTNEKNKKSYEIEAALEKYKDDPLFNEFLQNHKVSGVEHLWSNDTDITPITRNFNTDETKDNDNSSSNPEDDDSKDRNENKADKLASKNISDREYMEALKNKTQPEKIKEKSDHGKKTFFTVEVRGLDRNHKKKHIKQFFAAQKPKSIRVPRIFNGKAYVGFETEKLMNEALIKKNGTFLESKQISVKKYQNKKDEENVTKYEKENCRWKEQAESLKDVENIAESGRMFIRNLSYTVTENDIKNLFEKYGPLSEVDLPIDKVTRKPKGFGTVTFMMPEHAAKAYAELDGSNFHGRSFHILPGKPKTDPISDALQKEGLTFKEKKELERKATARSSHNWNTLFLGQNAVAEAIASTYNTTKEKILDDSGKGTSVAVRLALGETQLVEETRKFLEENGVNLNAFNQAPNKRSETVILVKNLPASTNVNEIRELFVKHGELGRVIMPPLGITALVEFLEPSEARKAFTRLALTKFKHLPLYLEKAPENSLIPSKKKSGGSHEDYASSKSIQETVTLKQESAAADDNQEEDEPEPDTTLYVKNVNFSTTDGMLKKYFSRCGPIHYATVATKKDPNNPGEKLSMGYAFIRYRYKSDTDKALKSLQMTSLDGKTLELKRSERTLLTDVASAKKKTKVGEQTGTTISVKNIPFQANANEITELFKAFGEVKAVRLPEKVIGTEKHRGFGFVEYYTKDVAKRAFNALCQSTHLYGRRLVLEWAKTDEDLDDTRKRTAEHFQQDNEPAKKSKKAVLDPESVGLSAE